MATQQAYGIGLQWDADGSGDFTSVANITDLTPPAITKDVIETTSHGDSGIKQFVGGLVDFGELSVTVNYDNDDSTQATLRTLALTANEASASQFYFKIVYADSGATIESFRGTVTGFSQEAPIDGVQTATITIKVNGSISVTS